MGWFSRRRWSFGQLFSRVRAQSAKVLERLILEVYGGRETASGITVTAETAMRQMAVHACVRILANSIAMLPCHLMQQQDTQKTKALDHPLYTLLHDQPNDWMTAPEFWGMCMAHLCLRGNFYVLKAQINGRIRELIPLAIGRVTEVEQDKDFRLYYKVKRPGDGGQVSAPSLTKNLKEGMSPGVTDIIPGDRIMHIRGLVINGFMGVNPIEYARESIGLALQAEKHGAKVFTNGARLGGVITHPGRLDEAKAKRIRESFEAEHASVENAHRTAIFEEGMKWTAAAMTNEDAQFLESRRFQKKEIVDLFFSMPLSLLMADDTNPTFASAEQFSLAYVTYALTPWTVNIERAIRRDLLNDEEKKTYFVKFNTAGLLRGDTKTRYEAHKTALDARWKTVNEVREDEDLNPLDEPTPRQKGSVGSSGP